MRNIKLEQQLDGDEHWPYMAMVHVKGSVSAATIPEAVDQPSLEKVIQSWDDIAVLKVSSNAGFYFGFIVDDHAQFLNTPIETEEDKFGVHLGDKDITFFVFAKDMQTRLSLEHVATVKIDDPQYATLPLY